MHVMQARSYPVTVRPGDILGIYAIYSKTVNTNPEHSYEAYQVTPCRFDDIFPTYYEKITDEEAAEMEAWATTRVSDGGVIPDDSFYLPTTMNEDDAEE